MIAVRTSFLRTALIVSASIAAISLNAAFAQCSSCVADPRLPSTPVSATTALNSNTVPASIGAGPYAVTLSGIGSGYDVTNQVYAAWCGDYPNTSVQIISSPTLYSTYASNLPSGAQRPAGAWNEVNYILNNKTLGGTISPTVLEVQVAIWDILVPASLPAGDLPLTTNETLLVAAAQANPNYVPTQVVAVDLYVNGFRDTGKPAPTQDLIIEVPLDSIGDYVWQDTNENGIQDAGEPGINGVTVDLCADAGCDTIIATTTTYTFQGFQGYYEFSGLDAGTYYVSIPSGQTVLSGLQPSPAGQGTPGTDSNPNPSTVTLTVAAPSDQTVDFGFMPPGSSAIGDYVWDDSNGDGLQNNGETGIPNVTVDLCSDAACANVIATTTTDQNGLYHFTGLLPGTYYVQVVASTLPANFVPTTPMVGSNPAIYSTGPLNGSPFQVVLPADTVDNNVDFGYVPPAQGAIGDYVWSDLNGNGIQDAGEPGINNVTVYLYQVQNTGNVLAGTTTTVTYNGADGYYQFTGLSAGTYSVVVDTTTLPPGGYTQTISNAGVPGADSVGSPAAVTLATNSTTDENVDFGYVPPCTGSIGDLVWSDNNQDGIPDNGELGIPGVSVILRTSPANTLVGSTTTDANGAYEFTGLCTGTYAVTVVTPPNFTPDSVTFPVSNDVPENAGSGAIVTLPVGGSYQNMDFGFYEQVNTTSVNCVLTNPGEVGVPFTSQSLVAAATVGGGTAPYTFSVGVGPLPSGLSLDSATGIVTGTPGASGTFTIQATDSYGVVVFTNCPVTIYPALSVTCLSTGTTGEANVPFTSPAPTVSGGSGPGTYTFTVVGGTTNLPAGLTLNADGSITGTPTASGTFSIQVSDSVGASTTTCPYTINPPLTVTCVATGNTGEVGVAFSSPAITVSGGSGPGTYTFTVVGTLPAGLTLNADGSIVGTPTASGSFSVKVSDSYGSSANTCPYTVNPVLQVTCVSSAAGTVGTAFNSGPMPVSGGTPNYTFSIIGTLPAGLSLNASMGAVTGTPTAAGSFSVQVTDAKGATGPGCPIVISPAPLQVTCASNATGTVGTVFNSGAMVVTGGTPSYTFSISGTLPAGLSLNASNGAVTGTPTASGTFSVVVTDSTGQTGKACPITINAGPLVVNCSLFSSTGIVGVAFDSGPMSVSGGTPSYTFSIAGTLPAGLSLNTATGEVTGTPAASGTFTVKVTDSKGVTGTGCSIAIRPAVTANCAVITAQQGVAIAPVTLSASGGTGSDYTFTASGLPTGLSISSSGMISGTPTESGIFSYSVTIKDSAGDTGTLNCSVTVAPPAVTASCVSITAVERVAITPATILGSGGAGGPYTFTAMGLPAGLSISSGGVISGTPAVSGTFSYAVTITDKSGNHGTLNCSITVQPPVTATCVGVNGIVGQPLTQVTLGGCAGGEGGAYTFSGATGLPPGVTISSSGVISGTPTEAGKFTYTVTVKDRAGNTGTLTCTVTVTLPPLTVSCPGGTAQQGTAYSSSVVASGGAPPYAYSVVAGTLPSGLTLNSSTGSITGTPSAPGSFGFTIKVTDSVGDTALSSCSSSCSVGVTNTWSFVSPVGKLGTSQAYTVGGIAVTAYGFTTSGTATDLYGQVVSGNEFGLGVYGATSNEIDTTHFVQLDLSAVIAAGATNPQMVVNSVQCMESYSIYGSNTLGSLGTLLQGGLTGDNNAFTIPNFPTYRYVSIVAKSGTVLLASVNFNIGTCKIVVAAAIDLQCGSCGGGNATVGVAYSSALAVVNGTAPYTFSLVSGSSLPPGLTLNTTTGAISGTPTTAGTYTFTSKVVDKNGNTDTQTCTIVVVGHPIDLQCGSCGTTGKATVGTFYSAAYVVVNGKSPYKFTFVSGTLPPGLTLNTSTGAISGTPTTAGAYTFTSTVVDANGNTDTQLCTVTVTAPPLDLECGACGTSGNATVGTSYSTAFAVTGGSPSYTFSIISGSLPPGLSLNASTGKITGIPTSSGTYTFTAKVVDSAGGSDTTTCTVKVTGSSLALACGSCGSSGNATVGASYSASVTASGGSGSYTYSISSGSLPPGLTLNAATGAITGKPTTANSYTFTTQVKDSKTGNTATATCTIKVVGTPVSLYCGSCASNNGTGNGTVGVAYSSALSVSGGSSPYTYSITSGSLPPGLTLNTSTGVISGTPTTPGTYTFSSKVVDKNGNIDTTSCTVKIVGQSITLNCGACGTNSNATVGTAYSETLSVTGGTAPYTYSISSGSLPPGLTLNTSTGVVSGTPATTGTYSFTSKVVDKNGNTDTATCTIKVTSPPLDLQPGTCGSNKGQTGHNYSGTLQATGGSGGYNFSVSNGSLPNGLSLNGKTGTISGTPAHSGTWVFTSQVTDSSGHTSTTNCIVVVCD